MESSLFWLRMWSNWWSQKEGQRGREGGGEGSREGEGRGGEGRGEEGEGGEREVEGWWRRRENEGLVADGCRELREEGRRRTTVAVDREEEWEGCRERGWEMEESTEAEGEQDNGRSPRVWRTV